MGVVERSSRRRSNSFRVGEEFRGSFFFSKVSSVDATWKELVFEMIQIQIQIQISDFR